MITADKYNYVIEAMPMYCSYEQHNTEQKLTEDDQCHTIEPRANVCEHPQQQTKLYANTYYV